MVNMGSIDISGSKYSVTISYYISKSKKTEEYKCQHWNWVIGEGKTFLKSQALCLNISIHFK